jgi:hypothetical protein
MLIQNLPSLYSVCAQHDWEYIVRTTQKSLKNTLKNAKGHPFSKSCPPHASCFDPPEVFQVGFQRAGDWVCAQ